MSGSAPKVRTFRVSEEEAGRRVDQWLSEQLGPESSRSQLHAWLASGHVQLRDNPGRLQKSRRVLAGEEYIVTEPEPVASELAPADLKLRVLFEDESLAVIVKPPGLSVHPGPGEDKVTLVNGLLHLFGQLPEPDASVPRPGIVHRLDRDTEGLLVVAKSLRSHRELSRQFAERSVAKEYLCWVNGALPAASGTIDNGLERHPKERLRMRVAAEGRGRRAVTHYEMLSVVHGRSGRSFGRVRVRIETGRTHQIRVHLASLGHPIVGDPLYSRSATRFAKYGMLLLARCLGFSHPSDGRRLEFTLDEPQRFLDFERACGRL